MSAADTQNPAPTSARKPWWRRAWPLAVLVVAAFAAFWLGGAANYFSANYALTIDDSQLRLGEVWESKAFPWGMDIKNPSREDITIDGFVFSCCCWTWKPKPPAMTAARRIFL
jgi:hypothetical protein